MITKFDMRGTELKSIENYKGNYAMQQNKVVKSKDPRARFFFKFKSWFYYLTAV